MHETEIGCGILVLGLLLVFLYAFITFKITGRGPQTTREMKNGHMRLLTQPSPNLLTEMVNQKSDKDIQLKNEIEQLGSISFSELAMKLGVTDKTGRQDLRRLINKHMFSGYVRWGEDMITPLDPKTISRRNCPHCGAPTKITDTWDVHCNHCDTDIYFERIGMENLKDKNCHDGVIVCKNCGGRFGQNRLHINECPYCGSEAFL